MSLLGREDAQRVGPVNSLQLDNEIENEINGLLAILRGYCWA